MQGVGLLARRQISDGLRRATADAKPAHEAVWSSPVISADRQAQLDLALVGGIATVRVTRSVLANIMVRDCRAAADGSLLTPRVAISSNGSVIARFHHDRTFRALIEQIEIVDADGAPLVFASRLFCRKPLPERVATTDFIHDCCDEAATHGLRFYFLGGRPGVAERAAERLRMRHPGLEIVGARHGYFRPGEEPDLCREIREAGTDVLWLGLGSPRQERFAIENRDRLSGLGWIRTCGGLFDHMAGDVRRAPLWMQKIGLEWAYRMLQEPRRLTVRYLLTNPPAAYHLFTKTGELQDQSFASL
jgi:N-acetylglucosaminyldiphosphoundecaprenol N-acetyl-beta-D-mannosaminyltransferase